MGTERKYTKTHEWVQVQNGLAVVGISGHAQEALGDITFIEPPAAGKTIAKGASCCVIESVKAASDIYAPLSGEVTAVNSELTNAPEIINKDPYGKGWLFKIKNFKDSDLNDLMDENAYQEFLKTSEE